MVVLRSREIPPLQNPPSSSSKTLINGAIIQPPSTPLKTPQALATSSTPISMDSNPNFTPVAPPYRRRSLRLSLKSDNSIVSSSNSGTKRRRNGVVKDFDGKDLGVFDLGDCSVRVSDCGEEGIGCLSLRGGVRLVGGFSGSSEKGGGIERGEGVLIDGDCGFEVEGNVGGVSAEGEGLKSLERRCLRGEEGECVEIDGVFEVEGNVDGVNVEVEGLRSSKRWHLRGEGSECVEVDGGIEIEGSVDGVNVKDEGLRSLRRRYSRGEKGKCVEIDGGIEIEGNVDGVDVKDEGLRSSRRRYTRIEKGKCVEIDGGIEIEGSVDGVNVKDEGLRSTRRRYSRDEKGKCVEIDEDLELGSDMRGGLNEIEDGVLSLNQNDEELMNLKRLSREEKGKSVMVEGGFDLDTLFDRVIDELDVGREMDVDGNENVENWDQTKRVKERFKNIARRNASKYAHFDVQEEERNYVSDEVEEDVGVGVDVDVEQAVENVEDWPGPFSTAMKIVRDREKKLNAQGRNSSSVKGGFPLINWTPRKEKILECSKRVAPSLLILCVDILVMNVDAITSLNCVPDAIRNMLCRKLCDSRKMNPHFLSLLLDGSPSEIRLADCSWLDERVFEKSFEACNTERLMVLQLDLGGHCVSDSSLRKALVPKEFKTLTTISLKGACRVSDVGLAALISSTPKLRSINLSQCSLLTDVGIESIASSLGSILQELYLDDCDTLDAMRILPILKRLNSLEVLSLRGIVSVSDKFIRELIDESGQKMKELVLANCVKLTDFSLKVIAEKCPQLCVLDLSYLGKLTDVGMAYLANGCRGIQYLKLDRCLFSDDAIAAFLESSGEFLKELSLNNIKKVGQNTTLSLARRCKNLESLDLSWCRCLTDEAMGLIADSCSTLRLLKIFGCTQITSVFVDGHSNPHLQIIGLKLTPILDYIKRPEFQQGPLHYSAVPPS